jgi:hypothetical protein
MVRLVTPLLVLFLMLAGTPGMAHASEPESGGVGIGLDTGFDVGFVDHQSEEVVSIHFPVSAVRVTLPLVQQIDVEPSLGFDTVDTGASNFWSLRFGLGFLVDLTSSGRTRPFFRLEGLLDASGGEGSRLERLGLAGGLGVRFRKSERWGTRVEVRAARRFEKQEVPGRTDVGMRAGITAFLD